jgi:hypothetical protein
VRNKTRADMCIPRVSTIYVGCFSLFWHSENGKSTFCGMKWKSASVAFLYIPRYTHVSDMASFRQTMPGSWPNLAHST